MKSIKLIEDRINDLIWKDSDLYEELQNAIEDAKELYEQEIIPKEINDQDIEKTADKRGYVMKASLLAFIDGAKWYRKQLKKKK
jgi:hypothetical protein